MRGEFAGRSDRLVVVLLGAAAGASFFAALLVRHDPLPPDVAARWAGGAASAETQGEPVRKTPSRTRASSPR